MGVFLILTVLMISLLYTFVKTYLNEHFKWGYYILCKLYLNKFLKGDQRIIAYQYNIVIKKQGFKLGQT